MANPANLVAGSSLPLLEPAKALLGISEVFPLGVSSGG
jgi:hypothetical protein